MRRLLLACLLLAGCTSPVEPVNSTAGPVPDSAGQYYYNLYITTADGCWYYQRWSAKLEWWENRNMIHAEDIPLVPDCAQDWLVTADLPQADEMILRVMYDATTSAAYTPEWTQIEHGWEADVVLALPQSQSSALVRRN